MDALLNEDNASNPQPKAPEATKTRQPKAQPKLPTEPIPTVDVKTPPVATVVPPLNPTLKIPDLRGKNIALKDKLYHSLGLSRKYIPRLTRRSTAIYQVIGMGKMKDRRLEGLDQHIDPYPIELVPTYVLYDSDEPDLMKRDKTMTFYEGGSETVYSADPISKKQVAHAIPKVGSPFFGEGGQVVVNIYKNYGQYAWWELHPRNLSNKYRDQTKPPIFERVDTKFEGPHVQHIKLDLQRDADGYVLGLKPDELIALGARLANPTVDVTRAPQELRLALRMRAKANPEEILYTNPNHSASIKIACIHALDFGVLQYVPEHEAYYMEGSEDPIFRVPVGSNPFEALVEFLYVEEEGQEIYKLIQDEMSFWF